MISYILQCEGQNLLQVVYEGGTYCRGNYRLTSRYIRPDANGSYTANMTKTQKAFFENSIKVEVKNVGIFNESIFFWTNKENPDPNIIKKGVIVE